MDGLYYFHKLIRVICLWITLFSLCCMILINSTWVLCWHVFICLKGIIFFTLFCEHYYNRHICILNMLHFLKSEWIMSSLCIPIQPNLVWDFVKNKLQSLVEILHVDTYVEHIQKQLKIDQTFPRFARICVRKGMIASILLSPYYLIGTGSARFLNTKLVWVNACGPSWINEFEFLRSRILGETLFVA